MISSFKKQWGSRWCRRDRILLLEQLAMFVSAGLTVSQGLEIIGGAKNKARGSRRKHADLRNIQKEVESGNLLSRALSIHIGLAKSLASIIEHGERVGGLAGALTSAHGLLVREDELMKRCLSAMIYPMVIGALAVVLTIGLMRGVVPQIIPMLTGMHVELPFLTRITIWMSGAIVSFGLYALVGILLVSVLAVFSYHNFFTFRKCLHRMIFFAPLIGGLVYSYSLSIFLRSFGTLISSGIPIVESYTEVVESASFEPFRVDIMHGAEHIRGGLSLKEIFIHKNIPAYVSALVSAGESSGSLGESLIRAASIIDTDLENTLQRLTSLIEPLMMIVVGGVVGAIALSIMMPIYDMSKVLQRIH
ncbi:MAG: type II secretion system F family protein [Candidatus Taylorbacteria bacterium]